MTQVFEGLRIVDLTMGWAGPLATMLYADFGADVIKIEGPTRPDWWRSGSASRPPADFADPQARNWERSSLFNGVNRNKRGVVLNLEMSEGRDLLRRLIADADVLVDSFSPRVMSKWGLTFDHLHKDNPRLITLSLPAVGANGPWAHYVGYAPTTEALSGMPSLCGYPGGAPVLQGPLLADPLGGLNGAVALAMALYNREETGAGTAIEVAQTEAMTPLVGPALIDWQFNARPAARLGDINQGGAPSGCYPCHAQDAWVVITVCSEDEWHALKQIAQLPALDDERFVDREGRRQFKDDLDMILAAWTATQDALTIMDCLQSGGVPAGRVNSAAELVESPHVRAAGSFVDIERSVIGTHPYPAITVRMSETPGVVRSAAPLFGEHTEEVLRDVLDLDEARIATLRSNGVVADTPQYTA